MKNRIILYFFVILGIILLVSLYSIQIPAPISNVVESYNLDIK